MTLRCRFWRAVNRLSLWFEQVFLLHDVDVPATGCECGYEPPSAGMEEQWWPREVVELESWLHELDRELSPFYDGGLR